LDWQLRLNEALISEALLKTITCKDDMFKKILLTIISLLLVACNNEPQKENTSKANQKIKNQLEKGVNYTFNTRGPCLERGNDRCITQEMYEQLCKASEGMTKWGTGILTMMDSEADALREGGKTEDTKVYWSDSSKTCIGTITVSGMYKGTSTRKTIKGNVSVFVLNDENKILAHHISSY
jgi:hypothetical protein